MKTSRFGIKHDIVSHLIVYASIVFKIEALIDNVIHPTYSWKTWAITITILILLSCIFITFNITQKYDHVEKNDLFGKSFGHKKFVVISENGH